jgi:antitoxin (DNA-binding transcriptional repressor) of toxin-antitoxin stability system
MSGPLGVAEIKRRFSEILNRIELRGELISIRRRGRTVAVIGPPGAADEAPPPEPRRGLAAAVGAWEDYPDVDAFIADIRSARERALDRDVEAVE